MLTKEDLQTIENEAKRFFEKLGMGSSFEVEEGEDGVVAVRVTVEEPEMFIGERGQTLFEMQHIFKSMVRKKVSEPTHLYLDVNDYRKNKEEYLRELARNAADEVALFRRQKELPPMPAAERRIIHMELAGRDDVVSESIGEGPDRRVVVKLQE